MIRLSWLIPFSVLTCSLFASTCLGQLSFSITGSGNAVADTAFSEAADAWASEFSDAITINLNFSFSNLGSVTLASTESAEQVHTFSSFRAAVGNDLSSGDDQSYFGGLSTGSSFSLYINRTTEASGTEFEVPYVDNDGGANNTSVRLTTANAKALGLRAANDTALDSTMFFNSSVAWDFNRDDGIDPGSVDFIGVAMHEIGHAMGFISGVDVLDSNGDGLSNDDEFDFVSALDFLRHSGDSVSAGADIDWTADDRDKYLSIDGGASALLAGSAHWSTGFEFGDGEQASHWKIDSQTGIMDPTFGASLITSISGTDLTTFDVIGYDRVSSIPEPSSAILLTAGLLWGWSRRRRNYHSVSQPACVSS